MWALIVQTYLNTVLFSGETRAKRGYQAIQGDPEQSWPHTKAAARVSLDNNSMWLSGDIWNHLEASGDIQAIWGNLEAHGTIWNHPKLSGANLVAH